MKMQNKYFRKVLQIFEYENAALGGLFSAKNQGRG